MQNALTQAIDFSASFVPQNVRQKPAESGFSKESGTENSYDSKKSFGQLVDDAKKSAENRAAVDEKHSESSEKSVAVPAEEKVVAAEEKHFRKEENVSLKEKKKKPSAAEKTHNLDDRKKISEKNKNFPAKDSKLGIEQKNSLTEKIAGKVPEPKLVSEKSEIPVKKSIEQKIEKNSIRTDLKDIDEKSVLVSSALNGNVFIEKNIFSDVKNDFFEENGDDIEIKDLKKRGKTFAIDKDGKITVNDLRTEGKDESSKEKLEIKEVRFDGKNKIEMNVEVANQNATQNVLSSNSQVSSAVDSNFQAMLQNQIQQNADTFVKAGNIVLKDNDVGEIKLVLHPESLGNVKIDLHLKDNSITGRIVVSTQEAFEAFKESAESLKAAFVASGFETAGFDLSFAGQDSNSQFNRNGNGSDSSSRSRRIAAYEGEVGDGDFDGNIEGFSENYRTNSVNIVA